MAPADDEVGLADSLRFDPVVLGQVKAVADGPLRPYGGRDVPAVGISFDVADGEQAERRMAALQPQLLPLGYRAFWSSRQNESGLVLSDVVAVLRTTDPYAILEVAQTDGANYGLTTGDVRDRLKSWEADCQFEIVGASRDWAAVVFQTLPPDLCRFVEDVFLFCHDVFEPEMGAANRTADAARMPAARKLCPSLSDAFWAAHDARYSEALGGRLDLAEFGLDLRQGTLENVQLFAKKLAETKYLFLWWD